jgi:hypothetical protein
MLLKPTLPVPTGQSRCHCAPGERCAACLVLAALLLAQVAMATGHPPRLGPSLNGVRRAASLLAQKLHAGENRLTPLGQARSLFA